MQHAASLEDIQLDRPAAVAIGVFDGVHRGHQSLFTRLAAHAAERGQVPVVLTFHPHPGLVVRGEPGHNFYLTLPDERAARLAELGVECVITYPFTDETRHMAALPFVQRLKQRLNLAALWVGEDFALGYKREGDLQALRGWGQQLDYEVNVVPPLLYNGERVSSSAIRSAIAAGDVDAAAKLLNRPHRLVGVVVEGAKRGRSIGFPTANISVDPLLAVPLRGVYAAWAVTGGQMVPSVLNIGYRPTFDSGEKLHIEAHLLDFSGDLYGQALKLDFVARLRDERKFAGLEELVAQIKRDVHEARQLFSLVLH